MPRLGGFSGDDLAIYGERIRGIARSASTMEDAARQIVDLLWEELRDETGAPDCAHLRLYQTHPIATLPDDLAQFARSLLDEEPDPQTRCLTLLATRGIDPRWNDRRESEGHKAIPLPSVEFVRRLPMVAGLIEQLGLELADVVRPSKERMVELAQRTYGVFHVEHARGSELIPAQSFVDEHGVVSALGFGGVLFSGDVFAVVIFSRVHIDERTADTLRVLSLATRVALMPHGLRVFA